ncbi:hypothetical protein R1sor_000240 [Riccia sorocarpa]|uniref:SET domain-containing protein n=1 Tax=Riccia sorocarpa TaxID=122646 RepID=A0ABD3GSK4_9MARC
MSVKAAKGTCLVSSLKSAGTNAAAVWVVEIVIIQRGITRKLQIFFTHEGKRWGLRTLEQLHAGAFVCEYVWEILTNMEQEERNNNAKADPTVTYTYPILSFWMEIDEYGSMGCGNRIIQRGITRKLQKFFTHEGKGWGLRTVEQLPAGAFMCEYIGEILTNMEQEERNINAKADPTVTHTYPILLDGDWCSEKGLKVEEALCLDATFSGNIPRFIKCTCSLFWPTSRIIFFAAFIE